MAYFQPANQRQPAPGEEENLTPLQKLARAKMNLPGAVGQPGAPAPGADPLASSSPPAAALQSQAPSPPIEGNAGAPSSPMKPIQRLAQLRMNAAPDLLSGAPAGGGPQMQAQMQGQPRPQAPGSSPFGGATVAGAIGFGGQPHAQAPAPGGVAVMGGNAVNPSMNVAGPAPTATTAPAVQSPADARAAAIAAAKQKSQAKMDAWKAAHPGMNYDGSAGGAPESLDQQQASDYQATADQLRADRAQALQNMAAASGLGGFGLSGASATLQSDTGRTQDRTAIQTLADLRTKQQDAKFKGVAEDALINDEEAASGVDINHDGTIGGPAASNQPGSISFNGGNNNGTETTTGVLIAKTPVTDAQRQPVPNGMHVDKIPDGAFVSGDAYLFSDGMYDYYQSAKDGSFHRVKR